MNTELLFVVVSILAGLTIIVLNRYAEKLRKQNENLSHRIELLEITESVQSEYIEYLEDIYNHVYD